MDTQIASPEDIETNLKAFYETNGYLIGGCDGQMAIGTIPKKFHSREVPLVRATKWEIIAVSDYAEYCRFLTCCGLPIYLRCNSWNYFYRVVALD